MKNLFAFAMIAAILSFTGCSKHYYSPAFYKSDVAYQFKPMSVDSVKSANYLTGALYLGAASTNDNLIIGRLSFNRSNTYQNLNISYGAYGFIGDYQNYSLNNTDAGYFKDKSLSGLGLRFSANTYFTEGNADIRLFGIEAAYSKEFGAYSDFRKTARNQPYIYTDAGTSLITAGITNEIVWHNKNNISTQYGYRFYLGTVIGNHDFVNNNDPNNTNSPLPVYKSIFVSGCGFIQINHYQVVIENQNFTSITLSLGYKF